MTVYMADKHIQYTVGEIIIIPCYEYIFTGTVAYRRVDVSFCLDIGLIAKILQVAVCLLQILNDFSRIIG